MHSATLNKSDRLQRVYSLLSDGRWYSTLDIVQSCTVCAVNSIIAELRDNGISILTRCIGRGRYQYQYQKQTEGLGK